MNHNYGRTFYTIFSVFLAGFVVSFLYIKPFFGEWCEESNEKIIPNPFTGEGAGFRDIVLHEFQCGANGPSSVVVAVVENRDHRYEIFRVRGTKRPQAMWIDKDNIKIQYNREHEILFQAIVVLGNTVNYEKL